MIREAREADRFCIVAMARRFEYVAEFPVKGDAAFFSMSLLSAIRRVDALCLVVDVGTPVGFLLADLQRSLLSPRPFAAEHMLWIDEPYRGNWFRPLVRAYEDWARKNGAAGAFLSAQQDGRTSKVFDRIGFKAVQTHHLKVF